MKQIQTKKCLIIAILYSLLLIVSFGCSLEKWQKDIVKEDIKEEISMSKMLDQNKSLVVKPKVEEYLIFKKEDLLENNEVVSSVIKRSVQDDKEDVIYKLKRPVLSFEEENPVPVSIFDNKIMVERFLETDDVILIDTVGNEVFSEALEYKKMYPIGLLSNNRVKYAYYDEVTLKEINPEINITDLKEHITTPIKIEPAPGKVNNIILGQFAPDDKSIRVMVKTDTKNKYYELDLKNMISKELLTLDNESSDVLTQNQIMYWVAPKDDKSYFWVMGLNDLEPSSMDLFSGLLNSKLMKSNKSIFVENGLNIWQSKGKDLKKVAENASLLGVHRDDKFLVFERMANFKEEKSFNVFFLDKMESKEMYNTKLDLGVTKSRISFVGIVYEK